MKTKTHVFFLDIAFFSALMVKLFGAGFAYFPVLDDYIQYGSYPLYENLSHVYFTIGTMSARPFASLLDPLVWGAFFPHMAVALLLIGILHFLSAKLFDRVLFSCGVSITPILYIVYLLLPLGFEGTYWISASSRIVVGLFFTALAAFFLVRYIVKRKRLFLVLYIISALLSFGFYESVTVFSGLVQGLLILRICYYQRSKKRFLLFLVPALLSVLFVLYYRKFSTLGAMGSRTAFVSFDGFFAHVAALFSQLGEIFGAGLYRTTVLGFLDGIRRLWSLKTGGLLLFGLIVVVSILCAYFSGKTKLTAKVFPCVVAGLFLLFLPLLPNVLQEDVWLTYRSVVVCLLGAVLCFAPLFARLLSKKSVRAGVVFLLTAVCLVGSFNELYTYKDVHEQDTKILHAVAEALSEDVKNGKSEAVLVLSREVTKKQTSYYKDHVKSVFYADWAVTGAVRSTLKNVKVGMITPVFSLDGIDTQGKQILYIDEQYHVTEDYDGR